MLSKLNILTRTSFLIGVLSLGASAAEHSEHYIIHLTNRLTNADINSVAARHGMTVVKSMTGSGTGVHVLAGPKNQTNSQILEDLHDLVADPAIQAAQNDSPVLLPGIHAAAQVHPPSAPPPALPLDGTAVSYYGTLAA